MEIGEILTPAQVAAELQCLEVHLAKMRMLGNGPAFIKAGGHVRYPRGAFRAWLESQMRTQTDGSRTGKAGRKPGLRAA
jgi:hypothetical protein